MPMQSLNTVREFASEFHKTESEPRELPIQFSALHGKGCRMERHASATMLCWESCKANQQVGFFSIAKQIPTDGANVLTLGYHAPEDVSLAIACCVDGKWTTPIRSDSGTGQRELSVPIHGKLLEQVALSVVVGSTGPQTVAFPWFSLHSGLHLT